MKNNNSTLRLPFSEIEKELYKITLNLGFSQEDARLIARTHTRSSCDGVHSHGINRFPRFVEYVKEGYVKPGAKPIKIAEFGAWERWDGNQGAGVTNAHIAINRAISLARSSGMGAVALRNTNHWMRAGTYGWMAAESGCMAICMTNTIPNMPPWGSEDATIGNNPIVMAVPRENGAVVLDMATSQFSYGRMEDARRRGEKMPYSGGWDEKGQLTKDPGSILDNGLVLPAGYWKGSGLSILMDMMVSLLADGQSSHEIGREKYETGLSQLFLCIDMTQASVGKNYQQAADAIIQSVHGSSEKSAIFYPGERTLQRRKENMERGIPVDREVWEKILQLAQTI